MGIHLSIDAFCRRFVCVSLTRKTFLLMTTCKPQPSVNVQGPFTAGRAGRMVDTEPVAYIHTRGV